MRALDKALTQEWRVKLGDMKHHGLLSNEQVEFETKNTMPLRSAPPKVKYIGINLTKYILGKLQNYEEQNKELNKLKETP